jgi:hypothetical protein
MLIKWVPEQASAASNACDKYREMPTSPTRLAQPEVSAPVDLSSQLPHVTVITTLFMYHSASPRKVHSNMYVQPWSTLSHHSPALKWSRSTCPKPAMSQP